MSDGNSRSITSNQSGVHEDLIKVVDKHLNSEFRKPYAPFSVATFEYLQTKVEAFLNQNPNGSIILDSCCGVGESSYHHAVANPDCFVVGIDKSEHRIDKHEHHHLNKVNNCELVRGDLNDLWRMIADADWPIKAHFILYPNPWPKSKHLQRRWHGAPVFKYIPKLGGQLTVRSNWPIYIQEFAMALEQCGIKADVMDYSSEESITPFERKYWASGQKSVQLVAELNN